MAAPTQFTAFRIAANFNVALGSLNYIEDDIYDNGGAPDFFPPDTEDYEASPVRIMSAEAGEIGQGTPIIKWIFPYLPRESYAYLITTYLSGNISAKVTINHYIARSNSYTRYNCYMLRPLIGQDVTARLSFTPGASTKHFRNVVFRFQVAGASS